MSVTPIDLSTMSVDERLQLLGSVWESLAQEPERLPVPAWQREELARRAAEHQRHPDAVVPLEDAVRRLRERHA